ncbi:MAG TPA: type I-C CRISPR-associated protein Cas8c/Csd1 [Dehalococcoidia bacterium]|nr:type I-C CRISPR-associated protein Cas8c/Csd1 [Dehalococcoidia bacterium]
MLLEKLREYSERLDLPPRLYSELPVRYIIELDREGRPLSRELIDTADPSSSGTKRGTRRLTPSLQRSVGIKPFLLTDKSDYVLGYVPDDGKPGRVAQCHAAFVDLVRRCAEATGEPAVRAVVDFLERGPLTQIEPGEGFDPGALIAFRVDGVNPTDLPSVEAFWAAENDPARGSAPSMQCIVCGSQRPALERLELKVKGVPGGQTSGTSIISFNAEAFESYGLTASLNAPTCSDCGERFTKAVNELLASSDSCVRLQNVAYVFWTKERQSDTPFAALLNEADPEQVKQLYESVFTGTGSTAVREFDADPFYAAALSGSGGRCVVREWIDTTIGEAKRQLARWFQMQRIIHVTRLGPEVAAPMPLRQLAYATVRTGDRNNPAPANVSRALLRTALTGAPLPHDLLYQAVRRCRAEQSVTRPRAALIKMVLLSQRHDFNPEEDTMVELDETNKDPAYLCGRLLAVLEQAQRAALPGINATIVDRFYGTASSAPASVFGRLMRGVQPHLARLERDRRGAWVAIQRRLEEVQADLRTYPRTLTLEQQGLFALGYYHERARRWAKAEDGDTNHIEEPEAGEQEQE